MDVKQGAAEALISGIHRLMKIIYGSFSFVFILQDDLQEKESL